MIRMAATATALAVAGACTTAPPAEPGPARLGETVRVGPVAVTPRAVVEDSRCPQAVRCVWQGRVRIDAAVAGTPHEMTLGQPLPVNGGALMLAEVRPARQPESEIRPADYRFGFRFFAAP